MTNKEIIETSEQIVNIFRYLNKDQTEMNDELGQVRKILVAKFTSYNSSSCGSPEGSLKSCENCKYSKGVPVNDDKCEYCSKHYADQFSHDFA